MERATVNLRTLAFAYLFLLLGKKGKCAKAYPEGMCTAQEENSLPAMLHSWERKQQQLMVVTHIFGVRSNCNDQSGISVYKWRNFCFHISRNAKQKLYISHKNIDSI